MSKDQVQVTNSDKLMQNDSKTQSQPCTNYSSVAHTIILNTKQGC